MDKLPHTAKELLEAEKSRGKWIFGLAVTVLIISVLAYLALHFWIFGGQPFTGPLKWYQVNTSSGLNQRAWDWGLWSVFGTTIFIMTEVTKYYQRLPASIRKGAKQKEYPPFFTDLTPWYITTFIRGPFIALAILLFLNAANLNLTGTSASDQAIKFNFSQLDHRATLLLAFVLGYYHRVARNVLDGIVRSLFSRAWAEANQQFNITPKDSKMVLGETILFFTEPRMDVIWAASAGAIDDNGKFTAPTGAEFSGTNIVITAVTKDTNRLTSSASVTLVPFIIEGPTEIELKDQPVQYSYSVNPVPADISWSLSPLGVGTIEATSGIYTAPEKGKQTTEKITIIASTKKDDTAGNKVSCSDQIEVLLKAI